jgi:hypothetical protein
MSMWMKFELTINCSYCGEQVESYSPEHAKVIVGMCPSCSAKNAKLDYERGRKEGYEEGFDLGGQEGYDERVKEEKEGK